MREIVRLKVERGTGKRCKGGRGIDRFKEEMENMECQMRLQMER